MLYRRQVPRSRGQGCARLGRYDGVRAGFLLRTTRAPRRFSFPRVLEERGERIAIQINAVLAEVTETDDDPRGNGRK
jgi:hypothetical protein